MLGENCPVATPTKEDSSMPLNELSDTPGESVAPVQPESSVEKTESQQSSPTRGEPRETDSSLTGEGGPALILIQVEAQSLTMRMGLNWSLQLGQMLCRRAPLTCLLRGICLLLRGLRLIRGKILEGQGQFYPRREIKIYMNLPQMSLQTKSNQITKKKRTLKSLKDFPLEPIFFKWNRCDSSSIFREILTEFGIKNNIDLFENILYAVGEIIRYLDQGEKVFHSNLKFYHNQYCKNNPNETQTTIEKFDDYLYRWAMKVWPRTFDNTHEYTRDKYSWS